jgi:hypothetical protein
MYHYDLNMIHCEIPKDHTASEYVKAYNRGIEFYRLHDPTFVPLVEVMDNVKGEEIRANLRKHGIELQRVPVRNHRANNAERAIRTWKNHWIATIAGCSKYFPSQAYRHLVQHCEQTLNLLRVSRIDPTISAFEAFTRKPYDYNRNPLFIPGHRAVIWDSPEQRKSFAHHGQEAFYIHGAPEHYRNAYFYVPSTNSTRPSDSIYWLPDMEPIPIWSSLPAELLTMPVIPVTYDDIADDEPVYVVNAPTNPSPHLSPISPMPAPLPTPTVVQIKPEQLPLAKSEGADTATTKLMAAIIPAQAPTLPSMKSEGAPRGQQTNTPKTTGWHTKQHGKPTFLTAFTALAVIAASNTGVVSTQAPTLNVQQPKFQPPSDTTTYHVPIDPTAISYLKTIKTPGPTADLARIAFINELRRVVHTTHTIVRIDRIPHGHKAPRPNPVLKLKCIDGIDEFRCRLTYNGRLSEYAGERSSSTIDIMGVKCFLNSIISDDDCTHITADIKDFYLMHDLDTPEYTAFPVSWIPKANRQEFDAAHLPDDATLFYRIDKALYGMPQAGMIAQRELTKHLAKHGYIMSRSTPCHYTHQTSGVSFVVWVDDFLIKYNTKDQASIDHLLDTIRLKYQLTIDLSGSTYLGMTIKRDRILRTLTICMQGYIQRMAKELNLALRPNPPKSPITPTSTTYSTNPQLEPIDPTPPATDTQKEFLQIICGKLLYYTLAVDPTIQVAVGQIASQQSKATQRTMLAADRLIQYILAHPDAIITYRPSNMILVAHSDASHDSEPMSRSRAGGVYTLGTSNFQGVDTPLPTLNGPVGCLCKLIETVCAGAYESEYAGLYLNATSLESARQTLEDFGYPQPATTIYYDNTVAGDIAYNRCKQRRSKAIARRYHWIQDRIAMGHFDLQWRAGKLNLADFLTKAHPVAHFVKMVPFFVSYPQTNSS